MPGPFYFHLHNSRAVIDYFPANITQSHLLSLRLLNNFIDDEVAYSRELLSLVLH